AYSSSLRPGLITYSPNAASSYRSFDHLCASTWNALAATSNRRAGLLCCLTRFHERVELGTPTPVSLTSIGMYSASVIAKGAFTDVDGGPVTFCCPVLVKVVCHESSQI